MLKKEEAEQKLMSTTPRNRLEAAIYFSENGERTDLRSLRNALGSEGVSYVKTALSLAVRKISESSQNSDESMNQETEIPPDVISRIRQEVTSEITGMLLHEISATVGLISSTASREIPTFNQSKTKHHVETLKHVLEAIEHLKVASSSTVSEDFDLAELIIDILRSIELPAHVKTSKVGAIPLVIKSDSRILRIAIENGIQNAVEASVPAEVGEFAEITVSWGETDIDYWLVVLDRGSGIVGPVESAFEIGKTSKKGHSGFGLTIARQAMESLNGSCSLQSANAHGARFEIRWPK